MNLAYKYSHRAIQHIGELKTLNFIMNNFVIKVVLTVLLNMIIIVAPNVHQITILILSLELQTMAVLSNVY